MNIRKGLEMRILQNYIFLNKLLKLKNCYAIFYPSNKFKVYRFNLAQ